MDGRERAYILENERRVELWEETPKASSGRCSDMTEVEKEKLIDMLYSMVDSRDRQIEKLGEEIRQIRLQSQDHRRDLQSRFDRMAERAIKAEREIAGERTARERAEKLAEQLQKTVDSLMDGSMVRELERQILENGLDRDAAKSSDRQSRTWPQSTTRSSQHAGSLKSQRQGILANCSQNWSGDAPTTQASYQ